MTKTIAGFPDFEEPRWMRDIQRLSASLEATGISRLAKTLDSSGLGQAMKAAERLSRGFDFPLARTLEELTRHSAPFAALDNLKTVIAPMGWVSRISLSPDLFRAVGDISTRLDYLSRMPALGALASELERLRPILEDYEEHLQEATTDQEGRLTLENTLHAVVEVVGGIETQHKTPVQRLRLFLSVLVLVYACFQACMAHRREVAGAHERAELRRARSAQGQTITLLTETIRELHKELADQQLPILTVSNRAALRTGPSGQTTRLATLQPGATVRLVVVMDRWLYVEVGDQGGNVRGWIYRRSVRFRQ